jgi:hypothetical protein
LHGVGPSEWDIAVASGYLPRNGPLVCFLTPSTSRHHARVASSQKIRTQALTVGASQENFANATFSGFTTDANSVQAYRVSGRELGIVRPHSITMGTTLHFFPFSGARWIGFLGLAQMGLDVGQDGLPTNLAAYHALGPPSISHWVAVGPETQAWVGALLVRAGIMVGERGDGYTATGITFGPRVSIGVGGRGDTTHIGAHLFVAVDALPAVAWRAGLEFSLGYTAPLRSR